MASQRIGLLDHMGYGNLGDAATQEAVIQAIRRHCPDARIALFSLDPTDSARRHGLDAYAIRRASPTEAARPVSVGAPNEPPRAEPERAGQPGLSGKLKSLLQAAPLLGGALRKSWVVRRELAFLARSWSVLRGFDLMVVSGGGQLDDTWGGGAWGAPWTLLEWALLARTAGTRLVFLSVGAGPLRGPLSKLFAGAALLLADERSFRDRQSLRVVRRFGMLAPASVYTDLAHAMEPPPGAERRPGRADPPLTVGIAPIPYRDPRIWPGADAAVYGRYVRALASFARWLLEQGHTIRFLKGDVLQDQLAVDDIRRALRAAGVDLAQIPDESHIRGVSDLVDEILETDVVVSSRFHGVVLAHVLGRPVIAISYHPKIDSQMKEMGQEGECLAIEAFDADQVERCFEALLPRLDSITAVLAERVSERRRLLETTFERVFGPSPPNAPTACFRTAARASGARPR